MENHHVFNFVTKSDKAEFMSILNSTSLTKAEKLLRIGEKCGDNLTLFYEFEDILNALPEIPNKLYIKEENSFIPPDRTTEEEPKRRIPHQCKESTKTRTPMAAHLVIDKTAPLKPLKAPRDCLYDKIYEKLPGDINLLFLGTTGTGKTTLINALVNYINYSTLDRAVAEGVRVIVKTHFTEVREKFETIPIVLEPNIFFESDEESQNENLEIGKSSTKFPRTYIFAFGPPGKQKYIRIIDTPGLLDTRGIDADRENFSHIMRVIAKYDAIHAISILVPSHAASLTLDFRYCVNELLSHLNKDATRNIVFCFTKCTGATFHPGESIKTLQRHLQNLATEHGIRIQLNEFTQYYFENDCYRFLCGLSKGLSYTQEEIKVFGQSWDKSVASVQKLLSRVCQLEPLKTAGILSVSNTRTSILALSRPFALFTKLLIKNQELIDQHTKELKANGKAKAGRLTHYEAVPVIKELKQPALVCTSEKCTGELLLANGISYVDYKTTCHVNCFLDGVELERMPNPSIKQCGMFKKSNGICLKCKCSWDIHMHIRYKIGIEMEKVLDVKEAEGQNGKAVREMIDKLNQQKEYYTKEIYEIQRMCAYFATFLKSNSLLKYNDSYQQYLSLLIREERAKLGESTDHLNALEQYKKDYLNMIARIEDADVEDLTINRINQLITELKTRKFHGNVLAEIQQIQIKAEREYDERMVDLSTLPESSVEFKKEKQVATVWPH